MFYLEHEFCIQIIGVFDEPINFSQIVGSGTVTYTGSSKGSITTPDSTGMEANKTYKSRVIQTTVLNGEITDCTVSDDSNEYLINGETKTRMYMNMATSYATDADASPDFDSFSLSLQASIASGTALSIKNTTTGMGGKFIISYAVNIDMDNFSGGADDAKEEEFDKQKTTLRVYNDADELVFEGEVSLSELGPSIADEI